MKPSKKAKIINTYETDYTYDCPINGKTTQKIKVNVYGADEVPPDHIPRVELTKDNEIITT